MHIYAFRGVGVVLDMGLEDTCVNALKMIRTYFDLLLVIDAYR